MIPVGLLKKKTNAKKLTPADPINKKFSDKFWAISEITKSPIDPVDGVKLFNQNIRIWQLHKYILPAEAAKNNHYKIDPADQDRVQQYKKNGR